MVEEIKGIKEFYIWNTKEMPKQYESAPCSYPADP